MAVIKMFKEGHNPLVIEDFDLAEFEADGWAVDKSEVIENSDVEAGTDAITAAGVRAMTRAQLLAKAEELEITVESNTKKDELIAAVLAALNLE